MFQKAFNINMIKLAFSLYFIIIAWGNLSILIYFKAVTVLLCLISQQTISVVTYFNNQNKIVYLFVVLTCFRLGESCSHVAVLLFKVEAAIRLGYTRRGCTELPCYWNNDFVKKVKPAPVHCIQFYKKSANKKLCQQSKQNRYGAPRISTDKEEIKLLDSVASCSRKPVCLSLFKEQYQPFCLKTTAELESLLQQLTSPVQARVYHCQYDLDWAQLWGWGDTGLPCSDWCWG